ncbi:MAG: MFS transporter [Marinovum algicola]|uniref:Major Facilitator Superfamily protein n=1 Tax=Marinovum algicola TaxID=42444 RepID=A0A975ZND7_9RHOB|nr:MFS transporter [Marinovum algicola]SEJ47164.1 Major Facilitator Superfamily protein [Marinovum algicola]SLN35316.1 putative 3-hydroxyphenylpropionic transporter MhpT [Marinovum algicola]
MRERSFLLQNAPWLAAGALLAFLSSFGQTFFISVFAGEIRAEFGLSHGAWGGIYSLGTTLSAAVMVWAGGLTDRFRARVLGSGVLVLLALACLSMAFSTVWLLPLVIFALRLTGQGMTSHISAVAMARWFVAMRGRALSIAALGFSFGEALLPIVFVALLGMFDWRLLWLVAAMIAAAGIPLLLLLLRRERTPQSLATSEQSTGMQARQWTRGEALRHRLFWFMVPALLGPPAFNTAFFFQQVHYAEVKGWAHLDLVALFPVYTAISVGAMIVSGWLLDKLGTARLMPFYQVPMVAAFVFFAYATSPASALFGFFFLALSTGANMTLPNAFWAEFYGTAHLGSIKAMAAAVMVLGSALGPGLTGVLIDAGVGIEAQYMGVAGYFVFASAMMAIGVTQARPGLSVAV